jgi:hypothetical protein
MGMSDSETQTLIVNITDPKRKQAFIDQLAEDSPVRAAYTTKKTKKIAKRVFFFWLYIPKEVLKGLLFVFLKVIWAFAWVIFHVARFVANGCTKATWAMYPGVEQRARMNAKTNRRK